MTADITWPRATPNPDRAHARRLKALKGDWGLYDPDIAADDRGAWDDLLKVGEALSVAIDVDGVKPAWDDISGRAGIDRVRLARVMTLDRMHGVLYVTFPDVGFDEIYRWSVRASALRVVG